MDSNLVKGKKDFGLIAAYELLNRGNPLNSVALLWLTPLQAQIIFRPTA
jgi:hypothetical protein